MATFGAGVATGIQAMAGILGLAYDSSLPDPTPTNEFFGVVFVLLYISTLLSAFLTVVALALSIVAATRQTSKFTVWVYVIFVVVCVLCVGTWVSGIASIPG